MRKLALILCLFCLLSCKKDASEDVTAYNWVLVKATVNPGKMYKGKIETDYMLMDPSTCLANNFTINFSKDGTYAYSSSGPLCDMAQNTSSLVWTQNGKDINLSNTGGTINARIEDKNKLVYANTFSDSNVGQYYTVEYVFSAKAK